jgi:hypothetical protein
MPNNSIISHKAKLLETAYQLKHFKSFADLGGCWGVNGGYAFHARGLCDQNFERGYIVDQYITPLTIERANEYPDIQLVSAMLGSAEAIEIVGKIDAIIMYDILLHQVAPNWDQFILDWLQVADTVIIYNQNWFKSHKSVRFVDCGLDWYLKNVYFNNNEDGLREWFASHYLFDEQQSKNKRDIHNWWQWGITPHDIIDVFASNNFDLLYTNTYGQFAAFPWIINQGMIFSRSSFMGAVAQ